MTTYTNPAGLDAQLLDTTENADAVWLVDSFARTDSYAALQAKALCEVTITPGAGGASFSVISDSGDDRRVSFLGASGTASAASSVGDLHVALVDTIGTRILRVTDEFSDAAISIGLQIDFDAWFFEALQATQSAPT